MYAPKNLKLSRDEQNQDTRQKIKNKIITTPG